MTRSDLINIKLAWRCVRAVRSGRPSEIDAIEAEVGGSLSDMVDALWYEADVSSSVSAEWSRLVGPLAATYRELTA